MRKQTPLARRKRDTYLSAYRRHHSGCSETNDLNCTCPLWVQGRLNRKYVRESLNTRSLPMAEMKIRDMLNPPGPGGPGGGLQAVPVVGEATTLETAEALFLAKKSGSAPNTVTAYTAAVGHFRRFAEAHGVTELRAVKPPLIEQYFLEYGGAWKVRTKIGRLTHLRVFFNWAVKMEWLTVSPAKHTIKKPAGHAREPFSPEDVPKILAAAAMMPEEDRDQARALVLLMLYSGMRISDATFLLRKSISADRILDYTVIKTRTRIGLPIELHKSAVAALKKLPGSGDFFFQEPGDYREAISALEQGHNFATHLPKGFYMAALRKTTALVKQVLALAGLPGLCHRFRDTFAINMLTNGVDVFTVSQALGHSDVRITQQHYLNLVKDYRQRMSRSTRVLNYHVA